MALDRFNGDGLARRIKEESSPVKTYPIVEWYTPRQPWTNQPVVTITKTSVRLNRTAREAIGNPEAVRIGWHNLEHGVVIAPCEKGDFSSYVLRNKCSQVTSSALIRWLSDRIALGAYEAEVVDGELLVRTKPRAKKTMSGQGGRIP